MAAGTDVDGVQSGRPLGFAEASDYFLGTTESAGIYWHVGIVITNQPLTDDDVKKACTILVRKQEALRMRVVPLEPWAEFQFKPMEGPEKIDFDAVTIKTKHDWPALISEDHDTRKIDGSNGPLWRFILARVEEVPNNDEFSHECVMLMKFNHCIIDGNCAFDLLYRQYLPILSAVINGGDAENVIPYVPQTKSVEETFLTPQKLKNPVPWYIKLGLDLYRWKNRVFSKPSNLVYKFSDDPLLSDEEVEKEPVCVPKIFDESICGPVIESAKAHNVTVHCILLNAGVVALCRTAESAGIILPATFLQAWPVDLRKFLDYKTPQPLADLHSIGMTKHKRMSNCSDEEFWKACQEVAASVKTGGGRKKSTDFLGVVKYFNDATKNARLSDVMREMGFSPLISLSNLGNTSSGPQPHWTEGPLKIQLTEHYFSLSGISRLDFGAITQFMVTFEKKFMWNVLHYPRRHSKRFVEKYLENLEEVLKTYCVRK